MGKNNKNRIATMVQKFLKSPPTIIWGSGATIPYGLPSMDSLKKLLKNKLPIFSDSESLEEILAKITEPEELNEIKKEIWHHVNVKDLENLKIGIKDNIDISEVHNMVKKIITAYPQVANIITTNYDRVLEYILAKNSNKFTDGFSGRTLSGFDANLFQTQKVINILKPHGSLDWFSNEKEPHNPCIYLPNMKDIPSNLSPAIIPPSTDKYKNAYEEPYRSIITKMDSIITNSESFLVIGFGFNDTHLTSKIINEIKDKPIVIITKKVSDNCKQHLQNSSKYILFEEASSSNRTNIAFKTEKNGAVENCVLSGSYWQLRNFMELW